MMPNLAPQFPGILDTEDLGSVPGVAADAPEIIQVILVENLVRAHTVIKRKKSGLLLQIDETFTGGEGDGDSRR